MNKATVLKVLLFPLLLITSNVAFSQIYIGMNVENKGKAIHAGFFTEAVDFKVQYITSGRNHNPSILSVTFGHAFFLTNNEKDNVSITPYIGFAHYKRGEYDEFYKGGEISYISQVRPIYNVELGKDIHLGRLFINTTYCRGVYFGGGLRAFFR